MCFFFSLLIPHHSASCQCAPGRRHGGAGRSGAGQAAPCLILQDDVKGVDYAGNVTQDSQQDVDEEVGAATTLKEDSYGRQDDGEDDLADVAVRCCVVSARFLSFLAVLSDLSGTRRRRGEEAQDRSRGQAPSLKSNLPGSERHLDGI